MKGGMWRSFALVSVTVLAGCGLVDPEPTTRTYEVAAHKSTCSGLFTTLCLQVREPGESSFTNLYEMPSGFDFEWGFHYVILVEETRVEDPPADASSIRRRLVRIEERAPAPAGAVFEIPLPGEALVRQDGDRVRIFQGPESLQCATTADCDALEAVTGQRWVMLTLRYADEPGGPFPLVEALDCGEKPFCVD
jgi:hypothetical protein